MASQAGEVLRLQTYESTPADATRATEPLPATFSHRRSWPHWTKMALAGVALGAVASVAMGYSAAWLQLFSREEQVPVLLSAAPSDVGAAPLPTDAPVSPSAASGPTLRPLLPDTAPRLDDAALNLARPAPESGALQAERAAGEVKPSAKLSETTVNAATRAAAEPAEDKHGARASEAQASAASAPENERERHEARRPNGKGSEAASAASASENERNASEARRLSGKGPEAANSASESERAATEARRLSGKGSETSVNAASAPPEPEHSQREPATPEQPTPSAAELSASARESAAIEQARTNEWAPAAAQGSIALARASASASVAREPLSGSAESAGLGRDRTGRSSSSTAQDPAEARGRDSARPNAPQEQAASASSADSRAGYTNAPAAPAPNMTEPAASSVASRALEAAAQPSSSAPSSEALSTLDEVLAPSSSVPQSAAAPAPASAPAGERPVLTIKPIDPATSASQGGPPAQPSREQIRDVMLAMHNQLAQCVQDKHGTTYANVTIQGSGLVSYSLIDGAFAGTEAGSCMARALRSATFPEFAGPPFKVRYPLRF
jgi:hypothetical protein